MWWDVLEVVAVSGLWEPTLHKLFPICTWWSCFGPFHCGNRQTLQIKASPQKTCHSPKSRVTGMPLILTQAVGFHLRPPALSVYRGGVGCVCVRVHVCMCACVRVMFCPSGLPCFGSYPHSNTEGSDIYGMIFV